MPLPSPPLPLSPSVPLSSRSSRSSQSPSMRARRLEGHHCMTIMTEDTEGVMK